MTVQGDLRLPDWASILSLVVGIAGIALVVWQQVRPRAPRKRLTWSSLTHQVSVDTELLDLDGARVKDLAITYILIVNDSTLPLRKEDFSGLPSAPITVAVGPLWEGRGIYSFLIDSPSPQHARIVATIEREGAGLSFDVIEPGDAISLVILHKRRIANNRSAEVSAHIVGGQVRKSATSSHTMLADRVKAEFQVGGLGGPGVSGGMVIWPPGPVPPAQT